MKGSGWALGPREVTCGLPSSMTSQPPVPASGLFPLALEGGVKPGKGSALGMGTSRIVPQGERLECRVPVP